MPDTSPFRHPDADDSPGFLLWKVTALWQGALATVLRRFGITQTQYAILASLRWLEARGEPTTQSHLAAHATLDKMTLSKAIRRLEQAGLVKRARSASDARATAVRFTARGRRVVELAIVAVENDDERFFSALSSHERTAYRALMLRLVSANG